MKRKPRAPAIRRPGPTAASGAEGRAGVETSEHDRIKKLRRIFSGNEREESRVRVGIGDDAAVFGALEESLVASVDAHVEGVHFTRMHMTLEDAGYRATMAALSDLAAMGSEPIGVLAALTLPAGMPDAELFSIARGQRDAAASVGCEVVGGNLARGDAISITTTVLGRARSPVLRNGARAGDAVFLGGPIGLAAAGLRLLDAKLGASVKTASSRPKRQAAKKGTSKEAASAEDIAIAAFRRPFARIVLGMRAARAGATAMIDVSDGLAADVGHLAKESGVDVVLDERALGDPALLELARTLRCSWDELALFGGEDFALVATMPKNKAPEGMRWIGTCESARGAPRVLLQSGTKKPRALEPRGFDHFRARG